MVMPSCLIIYETFHLIDIYQSHFELSELQNVKKSNRKVTKFMTFLHDDSSSAHFKINAN